MTTDTIAAPSVQCRGVSKQFGTGRHAVAALEDVTLTLRPGTVTALVGPSGCGKSTLLRIIAGLETASSGDVRVDDRSPDELRRSGQIAVAFQDASLLPWRSVASNIALARTLARQRPDARRVQELIDLVGLSGFERAKPAQLSGGMRQRAAIARCLVTSPRLLLLDEPFGGVDLPSVDALVELLQRLRDSGITLLVIEHNLEAVHRLVDRVIAMHLGEAIAEGTAETVTNDPRVIQAYLGSTEVAHA